MGVAVALMRFHRGSLDRQATLSAALVEAMGGSRRARAAFTSATSGKGQAPSVPADEADVTREGGDGGFSEGPPQQEDLGGGGSDGGDGPGGGTASGRGLRAGGGGAEEGPLVLDPWYQLVLCRECMLHGFHQAAEAGLRRLRECGAVGAVSDAVWVWMEVLVKVSAAEAYYGGSSDQV